jgi:cytochrome P450
VTARTAAEDYEYRGFLVRKDTALLAPQFAVQRDARFWPDPQAFDPGRFTTAAKATRPRLAYFPFGAGGRQCIGEGLAWMEGALCLAAMVQDWSFSLPPSAAEELPLNPAISLRPKGPVMLRVERR